MALPLTLCQLSCCFYAADLLSAIAYILVLPVSCSYPEQICGEWDAAATLVRAAAGDGALLVVIGDLAQRLQSRTLIGALIQIVGPNWQQQYETACWRFPEMSLAAAGP